MTYKVNLNKRDQAKWQFFKQSIEYNAKKQIFNNAAFLGNCGVQISFTNGQLCLEIMPSETTDFEGNIEGIIVNVDENQCRIDNLLKMYFNAQKVEKAKEDKKPIKKFTNHGG